MPTSPKNPRFNAVARRIHAARVRKGYPAEAVARLTPEKGWRKSRSWLVHIEEGRGLPQDFEDTAHLAAWLDIPVWELWGDVVDARATDEERALWDRRLTQARTGSKDLSDAESRLLYLLRLMGSRAGDQNMFSLMLADQLGLWDYEEHDYSLIGLGRAGNAPDPAAAPIRLIKFVATLARIAAFDPRTRDHFIDGLGHYVDAFGIADAKREPAALLARLRKTFDATVARIPGAPARSTVDAQQPSDGDADDTSPTGSVAASGEPVSAQTDRRPERPPE